jgi:hypothetical protein
MMVVVLAGAAILTRHLDPVALDLVNGAELRAFRADDGHMFADLVEIVHASLSFAP